MKKLNFDISEIPFSNPDKLRNITLPTSLNEELAEETGIHVGDGFMSIYNYTNRGNYWLRFTGHSIEEGTYFKNHLQPLLTKLYNFSGSIIPSKKDDSFNLTLRSKAIVFFKAKILKLPLGSKNSIAIPKIILKSDKKVLAGFIRGIGDTDSSVTFKKKHQNRHYYPVIHFANKSKILVKQMNKALKEFGIVADTQFNETYYDKRTKKFYTKHSLFISGKNNLNIWTKTIGFNNPVHITKFEIWKKFGFLPPKTTLEQRLKILRSDVKIHIVD